MTTNTMKQLTGRHVLFGLFGFFGVMLLVNGIFLYFALTTFNGLENPNAYQDGVNYNMRIEAERRQATLGWTHEVSLTQGGRLDVSVKDRSGNAVTGLSVIGTLVRPVSDRFAREIELDEVKPGLYAAEVSNIQSGNWIVALSANDTGSDVTYRLKERLWLKPN
jgi:nitrogen fixation protein FixH